MAIHLPYRELPGGMHELTVEKKGGSYVYRFTLKTIGELQAVLTMHAESPFCPVDWYDVRDINTAIACIRNASAVRRILDARKDTPPKAA